MKFFVSMTAVLEPEERTESCADCCPLCGGKTIEKKLKRFCRRCGQLCETCCDNGTAC